MSELIEVKTADLVGEQLAWAVGKAEGLDVRLAPPGYNGVPGECLFATPARSPCAMPASTRTKTGRSAGR